MFAEKLNYLFCNQASVGGYGVISSLFEFSIFFVQEYYGFSYQVEREKRFSSIEVEVIILC
jgi:hypothetical protein